MVQKDNKKYSIKENKCSWTVSTVLAGIHLSYNIPKVDYPDFESLKQFILESNLF